ncbi:MAG: hypothetical protein WAN51_13400 [Alphaproteobacteria bacterium]
MLHRTIRDISMIAARRSATAGFSVAGLMAATLALSACVNPTYYQPAVDDEGYSDQRISDDHYRIRFSGNSVTPREMVENYLLYRAAEITVATGHDYFVVVDQDVERDVTYRTYVNVPPGGYFYDPFFYRPYLYGPGFYDPAFGMYYDPYFGAYAPATTEQFDKYRAYGTIAVYSGERPANEPKAYDARDVVKRLSATILRPPP